MVGLPGYGLTTNDVHVISRSLIVGRILVNANGTEKARFIMIYYMRSASFISQFAWVSFNRTSLCPVKKHALVRRLSCIVGLAGLLAAASAAVGLTHTPSAMTSTPPLFFAAAAK